ncbi:MAG: amino acid ABC transporter permease [Brachymonas sp.]|nr:amino acid ABC transporter permease [Brachymonas sp.]
MSWDWQVFCKDIITSETVQGCFGRGDDYTYLNWMFKAWGWTAAVSAGALLLALLVGAVIGILRTLPQDRFAGRFWNAFATGWIELFRNIPLLVQIFIWYFVVPALVPPLKGVPSYMLVVFALGFFTSARIAEQVRAGIQSLPRGQRYAAQALGMKTWQTYRYVLLPMAVRIILPPLTSESMNLVKNSSAAFAVSIAELTQYAMQVAEETSRPIEVYLAVTVLYVVTAFAINRVLGVIEKRTRVPGLVAASRTPGGR